jgi:hypothetical protein
MFANHAWRFTGMDPLSRLAETMTFCKSLAAHGRKGPQGL